MEGREPTNQVLRRCVRTLQDHRRFSGVDELEAVLLEDLADEGYHLSDAVRDRARRLCEEGWQPGGLGLADLLRDRVRNPRLVPVVSAVLALVAWCSTSVSGALIEFYVTKPLAPVEAAPAEGPISAAVQVLPAGTDGRFPYQVAIGNRSSRSLQGLEVVAVAGERSDREPVAEVPPGGHVVVRGRLPELPDGRVELVTYVIGPGVQFRSEPVELADGTEPRRPPGVPGGGMRQGPVACRSVDCGTEVDRLLTDLARQDPSSDRYRTDLVLLETFARAGQPDAQAALERLERRTP